MEMLTKFEKKLKYMNKCFKIIKPIINKVLKINIEVMFIIII